MERVLAYAKRQQYTKYTSTLVEAWRISISGLSGAIIKAIDAHGGQVAEFTPDEDYLENPIAAFGISEARQHRKRGVSQVMFLGLLKYYRQAYQDLIRKKIEDAGQGAHCGLFIVRCFDLLELALSSEWNRQPADSIIAELQRANRQLANEKNRYLTIFESISDPVFLLSVDRSIANCNDAAAKLLEIENLPGGLYYGQPNAHEGNMGAGDADGKPLKRILGRKLDEVFPWMAGMLKAPEKSGEKKLRRELKAEIGGHTKYFMVILSSMLDVSGRYEGAVVVVAETTERKRLEEKILKLASTDPLTGVYNRRSFMEKAESELTRSRRYRHSMAMLMIDIDHFKKINDSFGHQLGDLALKMFAKTCMATLRENDVFGRIGGEEFVALLPEVDEKKAFQVAERLRIKISESPVTDGNVSFKLQASIGIAVLREGVTKLEDMIQEADQAMYSAKRQGRNRVVSAFKKQKR